VEREGERERERERVRKREGGRKRERKYSIASLIRDVLKNIKSESDVNNNELSLL
jgi:hypothetical protein